MTLLSLASKQIWPLVLALAHLEPSPHRWQALGPWS